MRNTENMSISQALAVFLFWLKNIDSQFELNAYLFQVRQALVKDFVSSNLGAASSEILW